MRCDEMGVNDRIEPSIGEGIGRRKPYKSLVSIKRERD